MSRMTKEINKITGTIIGISGKLIIYAVILLLLFEGVTKGYEFGHEIFYSTAVDTGEGVPKTIAIPRGQSAAETARMLKQSGLIGNELAFQVQQKFYDYDIYPGTYELSTAMTSKDILQIINEKPEESEGETKEMTDEEAADILFNAYDMNTGEGETNESADTGADPAETPAEIEIEIDPANGGNGETP